FCNGMSGALQTSLTRRPRSHDARGVSTTPASAPNSAGASVLCASYSPSGRTLSASVHGYHHPKKSRLTFTRKTPTSIPVNAIPAGAANPGNLTLTQVWITISSQHAAYPFTAVNVTSPHGMDPARCSPRIPLNSSTAATDDAANTAKLNPSSS